ncbi:hypothetical protein GCM10009122_08800 [Fulvivirga kasyanovii]|uniref:DUF6443 domain-containing protein n=1 Tax=Fulvivirga kasyanovii TaxID=396812 RepID=A0ABW9RZ97_9BACT|nr:DUF6443 domain-containing protein [Fulvivirga kasyanovii]MTI29111.1 hypothetical protein [Fulvivirga kasyanovii]
MKRIYRLIFFSLFCLTAITHNTYSIGTYDNFHESWYFSSFVVGNLGGGGSVQATIDNDILTISFNASFIESEVQTGPIQFINSQPALPDMHLGYILQGVVNTQANYRVHIENGYLSIEHTGSSPAPVITRFNVVFDVDLAKLNCAAQIPNSQISMTNVSCASAQLNAAGSPSSGTEWYWVSRNNLRSKENKGTTFKIYSNGDYFLRSYDVSAACWSTESLTFSATLQNNTTNLPTAETGSMNYVERQGSLIKETSEDSFNDYCVNLRNSNITYFDGLGREVQEVIRGGSPLRRDLVTATDYDANGRVAKRYLSYSHFSNDGKYKANYVDAQREFYLTAGNHANDPYPFAETVYEASPLNRVLTQGAAGREWQPYISDLSLEGLNVYFDWDELLVNPEYGGGGVRVTVLGGVLTVNFDAGFVYRSLKIGQIGFLHGDMPDMSLGSLEKETYYAYIKDGYLCIGVGMGAEPIDGLRVKFTKDLSGYGTISANPHTVKFAYHVNELSDEVKIWKVGLHSELPETPGNYLAGSLTKNISIDEAGNQTQEYTDKRGHIILKRAQVHSADSTVELWADTYYIYDDMGNLRFVLPPEASKKLNSGAALDDDFLADYAFTYRYDARNRAAGKRVPGAGWVYMVYDVRDRAVLTQDGNQRDPNSTIGREWRFTKYDQLNRPILTGIYTHSNAIGQKDMQDFVNGRVGDEDAYFETTGTAKHGYTDLAFPRGVAADDYLTVTYYDGYGFKTLSDFGASYNYDKNQLGSYTTSQGTHTFPDIEFDKVKGMITGTKTKVLDDNNTWLSSVTYYDERYRVIQTVTENYSGGIDRFSTLYNFPGWIVATCNMYSKGDNYIGIKKRYTYDHSGRLINGFHEIIKNGTPQGEIFLAANRYNALGQLIEKNLHLEDNMPHQSIDYRYNIRGWLQTINNSRLTTQEDGNAKPDLFGMELIYNNPLNGVQNEL